MNTTIATNRAASKPTTAQHKRDFFWLRRSGLSLLVVLAALCGSGAIYQAIATVQDKAAFPAPGQFVDVGGYKLHIYCTGEGSPIFGLGFSQKLPESPTFVATTVRALAGAMRALCPVMLATLQASSTP